jgi:hypothetical protein
MLTCLRSSGLDNKEFSGSPSLGELTNSNYPSLFKLDPSQL